MALPPGLGAALACGALWLGWSLLVGAAANQLPLRWLVHTGGELAEGDAAKALQRYERCWLIRSWKPWIPDAGHVLPGGIRKASLMGRDRAGLERLLAETRRAELVHLALWPFWLLTALWLPPQGVLINLVFATLFNLPCLWVQRYNRLRLRKILGEQQPAARPLQPLAGPSSGAPG